MGGPPQNPAESICSRPSRDETPYSIGQGFSPASTNRAEGAPVCRRPRSPPSYLAGPRNPGAPFIAASPRWVGRPKTPRKAFAPAQAATKTPYWIGQGFSPAINQPRRSRTRSAEGQNPSGSPHPKQFTQSHPRDTHSSTNAISHLMELFHRKSVTNEDFQHTAMRGSRALRHDCLQRSGATE
jgi:hypothetical protein